MDSVQKGDDDSALKSLIDLAEQLPKYLRPQLGQLFEACIKIFSDTEQTESWRHLALEIVVTLAETAPAMVRKVAGTHLAAVMQVNIFITTCSPAASRIHCSRLRRLVHTSGYVDRNHPQEREASYIAHPLAWCVGYILAVSHQEHI